MESTLRTSVTVDQKNGENGNLNVSLESENSLSGLDEILPAKGNQDSDDESIMNIFNSSQNGVQNGNGTITTSESDSEGEGEGEDFVTEEKKELENAAKQEDLKVQREREAKEFDVEVEKQRLLRLKFLLDKTSLYSNFLSQKIQLADSDSSILGNGTSSSSKSGDENINTNGNGNSNGNGNGNGKDEAELVDANGKKRKRSDPSEDEEVSKKGKISETESKMSFAGKQPRLITGGRLRHYQQQGVEWMVSLYENGLNGILADEMGLGKTIQCISLFAHLYDHGVKGPFLVVAPLSTLGNWVKEVQTWAPTLPVVKYHAPKNEREQLRRKHLTMRNKGEYPIVITSYELAMNDRKYLQKLKWKYIVVDEGHRMKNKHCKLIRELKFYLSANRLLLTGTPLQNNLSELWSMLNFLLPDIFDDLESFQNWFDFSSIGEKEGEHKIIAQEEQNQIVSKLHQILRPFLLRRMKKDVELDLPSKKERVINTTLSPIQQKYYLAILSKELPNILSPVAQKQMKAKGSSLQNMLVQLRKVCNHPYLFEWPLNAKGEERVDEDLIKAAGKMQLLDRLLPRLKKEGHKVLIFSQMTKTLDILEDYMALRKYQYCRLDGSTNQVDRETRMKDFNTNKEIFCFLLSTRAGGLGINLTAADTVIFYDNDWNPQMDLQAQDRCHRIGQTKDVRVFRLATANSIESRILERQEKKMKLERLVIQKGNFVGVKSKSSLNGIEELVELLKHETPKMAGQVEEISDEYLFSW